MLKVMRDSKSKLYSFKATLDTNFEGRGEEKPYREIVVSSNQSLSTLAKAIVKSFGFYFDHCYGFYNNFSNYFKSTEMYELFTDIPEDPTPGAKGVTYIKVATVFPEIGKKMLFLFDYGDNWNFSVELIGIKVAPGNAKNPKIVKKVGKAPKQYPPIKEDEFGEEVNDGHDWFHADCNLCNELKKEGTALQWFPDKSMQKKRIVN